MSLSQKTLDIDTIIVETLFNRGVPLSTSQAYMPIISPVGSYIPPPTYTQQITVQTSSIVSYINTVAGSTTGGFNDGIGTSAQFLYPDGIDVDSNFIYVADTFNNKIRKINKLTRQVTTLAGSSYGYNNSIGLAAQFNNPYGLALDSDILYISESAVNPLAHCGIRTINILTGSVTTLAGSTQGYIDNMVGTNAKFSNSINGVAVDSEYIYVADTANQVIRMINKATGYVTTLAGSTQGYNDNVVGTNAKFNQPYGVAVDADYIYVADTYNNVIRMINKTTRYVTTLARTYSEFNRPHSVKVHLNYVYVTDTGNNQICLIDIITDTITTVTGSTQGYKDGLVVNAQFNSPYDIAVDILGNIYVSDNANEMIRMINTNYTVYDSMTQNIIVNCNASMITTQSCGCKPISQPFASQFLGLSYLPIYTIYYNYFYGCNPTDILNDQISFEILESRIQSSIQEYLNTITTLSSITLSTFINLSTMNVSTITNYTSTLVPNSSIAIQNYNDINTHTNTTSTNTANLNTFFFTMGTLSTIADQLFVFGNYNYLQRPSPLPLPVPIMWEGLPPRYIGPGLSSLYTSTLCNVNIMSNYWGILSNTSTSWGMSNNLQTTNIQTYINYSFSQIQKIDTGSSISTVISQSNSTFSSNLSTNFYGTDVSSISTYVTTYFKSYIVPTNGPYISTGVSYISSMNSRLNSTLLGNISSGILIYPLSTFSSIVNSSFSSLLTQLYIQENISALSTLNSDLSTFIYPSVELLSLSTNVAGYNCLSSSVSTNLSLIITNLYSMDIISSIQRFSSILTPQMSTILGMNSQYITSPGLSSISTYFNKTSTTLFVNYMSQVSSLSTFLQYSTAIFKTELNHVSTYYSSITPITNYSTTRYIYPGSANMSQYMLRSTNFTSITLYGATNGLSSVVFSSLGVNTTSPFSFATNGGVNIVQSYTMANQPSLLLSNMAIYATDSNITPITQSLLANMSSIIFNSAFTIKRLYNSTLTGLIGINSLTPSYALDIGIGDARKLLGTLWLNPSDERIKENTVDIEYHRIIREISSLRLVSYCWAEPYRITHGLTDASILGFLSQEIEPIFPGAVTTKVEEGYNDFRTLNMDQIMKSKFGLTKHLIYRFSTLQIRINNLILL